MTKLIRKVVLLQTTNRDFCTSILCMYLTKKIPHADCKESIILIEALQSTLLLYLLIQQQPIYSKPFMPDKQYGHHMVADSSVYSHAQMAEMR